MSLKEYQQKRNFKRTAEPKGSAGSEKKRSRQHAPMFVVQKHAATRLHYDFRLEMEGVLKSWAVPKGFPTEKGDRRLAVEVEDHPLNYADFEGTIPEGNYGAGTVMVWDTGTYEVLDGDPLQALEKGKLHLRLSGHKLNGEWTLVRMRSSQDTEKPQWLVLKSGTEMKALSERAENSSVLTHRSMKQIASDTSSQWKSNRRASSSIRRLMPQTRPSRKTETVPDLKNLPKAKPGFVEPMKCELVAHLPKGQDWVYEIKFDGVRAIAVKDGKKVKLISRNVKDLSAKYPQISEAISSIPAKQVVIDGEIVAVDAQGRSSFQLLQSYNMAGTEKPAILYYAFDVVNLEGRDTTKLPLWKRKELLRPLVSEVPESILFSASIEADSTRVIKAMQAKGLEGIIAKQKNSRYESGQRSGSWVKYKWTKQQEFVIGGYTEPKGTRHHFGAILVGYYEGGKLMFASKVGTGFDHQLLESLFKKFQSLVQTKCPFVNLPSPRTESRSLGITPAQMKLCTWLKPRLVCEIRFSEWTRDGHLRQPVFLGLREDKSSEEVIREKAD
jgi:bifunctional non-homologous end joining protein LigD